MRRVCGIVSCDGKLGKATHVKLTCLKDTPCSSTSFLASPPPGRLLTLTLWRSVLLGSFSAIWGRISGKVVVSSTVSRNWPSLLVNRSIMVPY